jgi:branched-subunit amino acid aminotransferase/4-amino-4-deoxychorismate lyase
MTEQLAAVGRKIANVLAIKPQCFITHPSELFVLKSMDRDELRNFAEEHGWRAVRRIGGRQIEFYNDAALRAEV